MKKTMIKPWRASWSVPELEHRKYSKANMLEEDYSETVNLYFGDLHKHSSLSPCADVGHYNGSLEQCYEHARELKEHDFLAICDHAEKMTETQWRNSLKAAEQYNRPNEFIAWPAVEWATALHGHRNVYFNDYTAPLFSGTEFTSPTALWQAIHKSGVPALTIPHHAARELPANMTVGDEELERAYEIYSGWGNEEYYGAPMQDTDHCYTRNFAVDTLLRGHKLGFVAGGDGHPAAPGESGITGIYAPDLTLKSLWKALKQRRTIATTGAKILLDFHINNMPMGSIRSFNIDNIDELFPLEISVTAQGTAPIEKIEIIENGVVVYTKTKARARLDQMSFRWFREKQPSNGCHLIGAASNVSRFIYVRLTQRDGHMAWVSPIWLDFSFE